MKREVLEIIPKPFRRPRVWFSPGGNVEITNLRSGETERIRFSGGFGHDVIRDRMRKAVSCDTNCFLFDLGHINTLNAIFVGTMANCKMLAEDLGARTAFFGMNDNVRARLARTQMADVFTIFESREKALEFLES